MTYQLASHEEQSVVNFDGRGSAVDYAFRDVVGDSEALRKAMDFAGRVAARRLTTVLLSGETGTGKELFARGIHYAGPEPGEPFVAVNCPAIPPTLLESELFGHEKGAFTDARSVKKGLFELAAGGTLFLDEITDLPADLQPKLLRALEERKVRRLGGFNEIAIKCRVIAATNRSLEREVAEGKFREDLFYRLNVLRLVLPPLRERHGDIEILALHFAEQVAREHGIPIKELSAQAVTVLNAHDWPGNARELKNVIQRAALLGVHPRIHADDLAITRRAEGLRGPAPVDTMARVSIPPEGRSLESIVAEAIQHTLALTGGNRSAAARILGISRPTLLRNIEKHAIPSPERTR